MLQLIYLILMWAGEIFSSSKITIAKVSKREILVMLQNLLYLLFCPSIIMSFSSLTIVILKGMQLKVLGSVHASTFTLSFSEHVESSLILWSPTNQIHFFMKGLRNIFLYILIFRRGKDHLEVECQNSLPLFSFERVGISVSLDRHGGLNHTNPDSFFVCSTQK